MIVRKSLFALAVVALIAGGGSAEAGAITGLFSTGVGLGLGATDPHYTVTGPNAATVQATVIPSNPGYPVMAGSQFITDPAYPFLSQPVGTFLYTTTFNDTDATGFVNGSIAADDTVVIRLNGVVVTPSGPVSYNSFTPFSITSGFVSGLNTLTFTVSNIGGPEALDVGISSVSVPEPASLGMVALGLGAVAAVRRARRKTA